VLLWSGRLVLREFSRKSGAGTLDRATPARSIALSLNRAAPARSIEPPRHARSLAAPEGAGAPSAHNTQRPKTPIKKGTDSKASAFLLDASQDSVTLAPRGLSCLGSEATRFSFFSVEIPVTSLPKEACHLHSLSALRRLRHIECFRCLAATAPAPNSRGPHPSVLRRRFVPLPIRSFFSTSLPSLGPKTASGLASNAFRRSAARSSGMHATPAPFFTLSSRGCSTPR